MKNYSKVLSWLKLENNNIVKLASGASQFFLLLTILHFKLQNMIKYLAKFEHLFCPKVGAQTHVCPLLFFVFEVIRFNLTQQHVKLM